MKAVLRFLIVVTLLLSAPQSEAGWKCQFRLRTLGIALTVSALGIWGGTHVYDRLTLPEQSRQAYAELYDLTVAKQTYLKLPQDKRDRLLVRKIWLRRLNNITDAYERSRPLQQLLPILSHKAQMQVLAQPREESHSEEFEGLNWSLLLDDAEKLGARNLSEIKLTATAFAEQQVRWIQTEWDRPEIVKVHHLNALIKVPPEFWNEFTRAEVLRLSPHIRGYGSTVDGRDVDEGAFITAAALSPTPETDLAKAAMKWEASPYEYYSWFPPEFLERANLVRKAYGLAELKADRVLDALLLLPNLGKEHEWKEKLRLRAFEAIDRPRDFPRFKEFLALFKQQTTEGQGLYRLHYMPTKPEDIDEFLTYCLSCGFDLKNWRSVDELQVLELLLFAYQPPYSSIDWSRPGAHAFLKEANRQLEEMSQGLSERRLQLRELNGRQESVLHLLSKVRKKLKENPLAP